MNRIFEDGTVLSTFDLETNENKFINYKLDELHESTIQKVMNKTNEKYYDIITDLEELHLFEKFLLSKDEEELNIIVNLLYNEYERRMLENFQ